MARPGCRNLRGARGPRVRVKEANQDALTAICVSRESLAPGGPSESPKRGRHVAEFVRSKTYHQCLRSAAIHDWRSIYTYRSFTAFLRESPAVDVHIVTQESGE